ncbi:hypothetical protein MVES1_000794 [Malassezia vespertilionis]|uniref:Fatty acid hydroxylase domain-containing protein n=1 Tax=Malassezia vespertilionis TaxID=2020962 RepID=A0A2N1JEU5_9BASI|nr:uncharacterized protein MVES1_000794 [Malassezia vespertilionis]PKI85036.1 hypothetical protein MVES_000743 [Malassezia vespertilionis]WFD05464.1 hypothetical protein MVES1_000794 [Malassezia vespertilionis]
MVQTKTAASDLRPRPGADAWKNKPFEELTFAQKALMTLGLVKRDDPNFSFPKPEKKIPVFLEWQQHKKLFPMIFLTFVLRWIYMRTTGNTIHPLAMYGFTLLVGSVIVDRQVKFLVDAVKRYGYLDAGAERDSVPEGMTGKLGKEFLVGFLVRPLLVHVLSYNRFEMPSLSLWLPVQLFIFTMIVDFIYYWVHRATHEVPFLWKYHSRHHTTKHPVVYLAAFADEPQEVFDVLGSPVIAYLLYPIGYDAFLIWSFYFVCVELLGHTGMRVYYPALITSTLLRPFGLEGIVEDHDLHHRMGWRDSFNYSKQSGFWDTLFGTFGERVECVPENIDYNFSI